MREVRFAIGVGLVLGVMLVSVGQSSAAAGGDSTHRVSFFEVEPGANEDLVIEVQPRSLRDGCAGPVPPALREQARVAAELRIGERIESEVAEVGAAFQLTFPRDRRVRRSWQRPRPARWTVRIERFNDLSIRWVESREPPDRELARAGVRRTRVIIDEELARSIEGTRSELEADRARVAILLDLQRELAAAGAPASLLERSIEVGSEQWSSRVAEHAQLERAWRGWLAGPREDARFEAAPIDGEIAPGVAQEWRSWVRRLRESEPDLRAELRVGMASVRIALDSLAGRSVRWIAGSPSKLGAENLIAAAESLRVELGSLDERQELAERVAVLEDLLHTGTLLRLEAGTLAERRVQVEQLISALERLDEEARFFRRIVPEVRVVRRRSDGEGGAYWVRTMSEPCHQWSRRLHVPIGSSPRSIRLAVHHVD